MNWVRIPFKPEFFHAFSLATAFKSCLPNCFDFPFMKGCSFSSSQGLVEGLHKLLFFHSYHRIYCYATFLFKTPLKSLQYAWVNRTVYGKCG